MAKTSVKRGRPGGATEAKRRNIVSIGMTDSLKRAMEVVAEHEKCSMSRAIELSLDRYFHGAAMFGDNYKLQMFGRLMAAAFAMGGNMVDWGRWASAGETAPGEQGQWLNNPNAYEVACREVIQVLARYRPEGVVEEHFHDLIDDGMRSDAFGSLTSFFEQQKSLPRGDAPPTVRSADGVLKRDAVSMAQQIDLQNRAQRLKRDVERALKEAKSALDKANLELNEKVAAGEDTNITEWIIATLTEQLDTYWGQLNAYSQRIWPPVNFQEVMNERDETKFIFAAEQFLDQTEALVHVAEMDGRDVGSAKKTIALVSKELTKLREQLDEGRKEREATDEKQPSHVDVPEILIGTGEHYALTVDGDSMVEAGIFDGDLVVIQRCDDAEDGTIVVARVDGEEVTLKRLRRDGDTIALEPANSDYETRVFEPGRVKIQGRLVGMVRQYSPADLDPNENPLLGKVKKDGGRGLAKALRKMAAGAPQKPKLKRGGKAGKK